MTTAGGVEEDLIKCLAPTFLGGFHLAGRMLRERGINRIGNLLVPNDNYCAFEDWITPILDRMLQEQKEQASVVDRGGEVGGEGANGRCLTAPCARFSAETYGRPPPWPSG